MKVLKITVVFIFLSLLAVLLNCSSINALVKGNLQKPQVKVTKAGIAGLSFSKIDLLFDLKVKNPNSIDINLKGFDYDFLVNDNSFLTGKNEEGIKITANGEHTSRIPVSIKFADLYNTYSSIKSQDSSNYELKAGFVFDVPVLGGVRVPVSKKGVLPLLKLPSLSVSAMRVNKLNFSGADLILELNIRNPNSFTMMLDKLDYNLQVNDRQWAQGILRQQLTVPENRQSMLEVPISLNFLEMGSSVFQMLQGDTGLNYQLRGEADLSSSLSLLEQFNLPLDLSGNIAVTR